MQRHDVNPQETELDKFAAAAGELAKIHGLDLAILLVASRDGEVAITSTIEREEMREAFIELAVELKP